ncbi:M23 family metallopeptidase [Amnibacterium sp. CER49]|uniref:M23 family metallopeptidase n=1 Tax=Amnibacterium sp. CER49 TaxID=3039161 RepID=UPI00244807B6|nr:M23 family metallopeptidase [Amnibacterium sp. CER49]MDH2442373.1 M23 family metallopeptidase [Amnibacterium sp. CER49]
MLLAVWVVAALLVAVSLPAQAARAESYPSWSDVERACSSEQAKLREIARLEKALASLRSRAAGARREANRRAAEYERAQEALTASTYRAWQLDRQAAASRARAARSTARAGRMAAGIARSSSTSLTARLLLDDQGTGLLSRLEMLQQLAKASDAIASTARRDRDTAAAVAGQARTVRAALAGLAAAAQRTFAGARDAQQRADEDLAAQQANEATMQAQLAVLRENRRATQADYDKGVAARRAAAAAARAAAAGASAAVGASGWALPVSGWISDPYGPRPNAPVEGVRPFHAGTDLAAACGTPVHAASAGTVSYAGWLGTYGNFVLIDHGGGIQTAYGHNASIAVGIGTRVAAGEVISQLGSTGASTGCHLHFEVREGGSGIDPVPFMRARGVTLG